MPPLLASVHVPREPKEPVVKHLSLYVIATVNTAPTARPKSAAAPARAKKRFFRVPSFVRTRSTPQLESREAAA
jgi:hypothetical protein